MAHKGPSAPKSRAAQFRVGWLTSAIAAAIGIATLCSPAIASQRSGWLPGVVTIENNRLIRDGRPWIPHGFVQIAFVAPPAAQQGVFTQAYQHYSPADYASMRAAGADTVRMQVSQPGLDHENPLFTVDFRDRVIAAVRAARAAGLTVIISIQDETQSGETKKPAPLPDEATRRVWRKLASVFREDQGVMFELLNEPNLDVSPANWHAWGEAMNRTVRTVRSTGARNVVVADGLRLAEHLDGAPFLNDPLRQVAYASHPYFHTMPDQTQAVWETKFGKLSEARPVIITEWTTATNPRTFCDSTTPGSVVRFLKFLANHNVGLMAFAWDFSATHFGSAIRGLTGEPSTFVGVSCGETGFGPGKMIETWYRTGSPPTSVE